MTIIGISLPRLLVTLFDVLLDDISDWGVFVVLEMLDSLKTVMLALPTKAYFIITFLSFSSSSLSLSDISSSEISFSIDEVDSRLFSSSTA